MHEPTNGSRVVCTCEIYFVLLYGLLKLSYFPYPDFKQVFWQGANDCYGKALHGGFMVDFR